jgi:hypothetical protein
MEQGGHAADRRPHGCREHSRPVHIEQIGVCGKTGDPIHKVWSLRSEAQPVAEIFAASRIRTAGQGRSGRSKRPRAVEQWTVSGSCDMRFPAALGDRRKKIEKTVLSAAEVAELIQKQDLHRRGIAASTKKYTGSTRQ